MGILSAIKSFFVGDETENSRLLNVHQSAITPETFTPNQDNLYVSSELVREANNRGWIIDDELVQQSGEIAKNAKQNAKNVKKFGKNIYLLAANYNFGQLSEKWTRKIAKEHGAEVIASEFFPLDVNQFGPTIGKIQAAKPSFIVNTFVGPGHGAFYGQWAGAGMKKEIPIASQTFGEAGEQLRMPPELSEGIFVCYNYMEELALPSNAAFLKRFRDKFGANYGYISDLGMSEYMGVRLWAEAVKKARSIERERVIKALEAGLSIEGPGGTMAVDPKTHHCIFGMHIAEMKSRKFEIIQSFKQVRPTNPDGVCDLINNPNTNQQFEPKI